jgi:maltose O-acetyltransferase
MLNYLIVIIKLLINKTIISLLYRLSPENLSKIYFLLKDSHLKHNKSEMVKKYKINLTVRISYGTQLYGDGEIEIDEQTYFGENCFIQSQKPAKIKIGKYCAFAHNIHLRTSDYNKTKHFSEALESENLIRSIEIGDYVWVGANVYINGGLKIGSNSIIGANSVVTKDVPPNSIVGGVPARVIRYKDEKYLQK